MNINGHLLNAIQASIQAGKAILDVYHSDFSVEYKTDSSPLTLADRRSHEVIVKHLSEYDIPILSEEGKNISYAERKSWDRLWIVDPLDGTKEFVKRNGEEEHRMQKETLTVPNISCGHCVMNIKNELSEMEGVNSVDGSPEAKSIMVEFEAPATLDRIKESLKEINYPAS